jgi:large subunit ribosomal protein L25
MEREILQASKRTKLGTGNSRRMRREQIVPGILYGKEVETFTLEVPAKPLSVLLKKFGEENILLDVEVEGKKHTVLLKEVQVHPLSGAPLHIDFHQVSMKEKITVTVPVVIKGAEECPGVMEGGVVETLLNELEVRCLPLNIPPIFELDISGLSTGENIHVSEIKVPDDVEILTAPERTVVTVSKASEVEVEEEATGEPEVIGAEGEEGAEKAEAGGEKKAEEKEDAKAGDKKEEKSS